MRTIAAMAVLAAVCGGSPGWAQLQAEDVHAVNARAHANAIKTAYFRLEDFILRRSTAATPDWGHTPPSATGWLPSWTDRGVRARYCEGTLLVYMEPLTLMGVGTDQRSVHAAPRLYGGERRRLHWLEGDVAEGGDGRPDVALPPCMQGLVPSGRAALAGEVEDPWTATRERSSWETRDLNVCPAGFHRPAGVAAGAAVGTERRRITVEVNRRDEEVSRDNPGWKVASHRCVANYTVTETKHEECGYEINGTPVTGYTVSTREKTVGRGPEPGDDSRVERPGPWTQLFSTCSTGALATPLPGGVGPEAGDDEDDELSGSCESANTFIERPETESVPCPDCFDGTASRTRTHIDGCTGVGGVCESSVAPDCQVTNWIVDESACTPEPPTVLTNTWSLENCPSYDQSDGAVNIQRSVRTYRVRFCGEDADVSATFVGLWQGQHQRYCLPPITWGGSPYPVDQPSPGAYWTDAFASERPASERWVRVNSNNVDVLRPGRFGLYFVRPRDPNLGP